MKFIVPLATAFATRAFAAPSPTVQQEPRQASAGCASAVTLDASTNVWTKYTLHPNNYYSNEVKAAVGNLTDSSLSTAAAKLENVGTFLWM
jgi:cellulose 1,4-beta-cellobiosidase